MFLSFGHWLCNSMETHLTSHYMQEWQMMYKQECVLSHLNNVIFGKKLQSDDIHAKCNCHWPLWMSPAVLYSLPFLNPTSPHWSLSLTAVQILKWLEDICKQEGVIIRLVESTRKHGLKSTMVKNWHAFFIQMGMELELSKPKLFFVFCWDSETGNIKREQ